MLRHLVGLVILGLAVTAVVLAVAGYIGYSILLMLSPRTAARLRGLVDRSARNDRTGAV
jgi:hypothetical protein